MRKYLIIVGVVMMIGLERVNLAEAKYHFVDFRAHPPLHVYKSEVDSPAGLKPDDVKAAYNLPSNAGKGTIAIVAAYGNPQLEQDLDVFNKQFNLPACTVKNGCLQEHRIGGKAAQNKDWALETALDVEWAHAIAPKAKILVVAAGTPSAATLLKAIDYARSQPGVAAVSMSWGGSEFPEETTLDDHFTSNSGIVFFAASGDSGAGTSWPAASPNVVGVGGTSLTIQNGQVRSESAWAGSGGGLSAYEAQPVYQADYNMPRAKGMRATPDVAYNADPRSGFAVYHSSGRASGVSKSGGWYMLGGTSAGAPQWAAIQALGGSATLPQLYADKRSAKHADFFRDITSGVNGDCVYYCEARKKYNYVTGLGSPLTANF
jgi:subtilase family serine protease